MLQRRFTVPHAPWKKGLQDPELARHVLSELERWRNARGAWVGIEDSKE